MHCNKFLLTTIALFVAGGMAVPIDLPREEEPATYPIKIYRDVDARGEEAATYPIKIYRKSVDAREEEDATYPIKIYRAVDARGEEEATYPIKIYRSA